MAEILVEFSGTVADRSGRQFAAKVCGRAADDGLWEGWIEFDPRDGTQVLRTPRETEQPNRADLEYWATGLTEAYLEGALERAQHPRTPDPRSYAVTSAPTYDRPAPRGGSGQIGGSRPGAPVSRPVLNPFQVYTQGEDVLRRELGALDGGHLRNIARAYDLIDEGAAGGETVGRSIDALGRDTLADLIVDAVRRRAGSA